MVNFESLHSVYSVNGHEFDQTPGDSEGHGSLASCSLGGHKESDTAEQLNNNKLLDWAKFSPSSTAVHILASDIFL